VGSESEGEGESERSEVKKDKSEVPKGVEGEQIGKYRYIR